MTPRVTGVLSGARRYRGGTTGLLFVAVSINLENILQAPEFPPPRAAERLRNPAGADQLRAHPRPPEQTTVGHRAARDRTRTARDHPAAARHPARAPADPAAWHRSRVVTTAAPAIPTAITGISLIVHWGGGLYWLAPAAVLGTAADVYGGWVPLAEIVRRTVAILTACAETGRRVDGASRGRVTSSSRAVGGTTITRSNGVDWCATGCYSRT
jgi:hypothetical protein